MFFDRILGSSFGVQVGRKNFKETREWWWDDDLDAVRLYFDRAGWHAELGRARELAWVSSLQDGIDQEQQDVVRTLGRVSWLWAPRQKLEAYFLHADDRSGSAPVGTRLDEALEDPGDARLTWYGLPAIGSRDFGRRGAVEYWADWAAMTGDETRIRYGTVGTVSTVTRIGARDVRGFREGRRLDIEVAAGMFLAGEAYAGSGRRKAYFGQVEFTWNF